MVSGMRSIMGRLVPGSFVMIVSGRRCHLHPVAALREFKYRATLRHGDGDRGSITQTRLLS